MKNLVNVLKRNYLLWNIQKIPQIHSPCLSKTEGGLPIKRFVHSDDVSPGISQILDISCMCQEFDFLDIEVWW